MLRHRKWWIATVAVVVPALVLGIATWHALMPLPASLAGDASATSPTHFLAADGTPLNLSFRDPLNRAAVLPASRIPPLVR